MSRRRFGKVFAYTFALLLGSVDAVVSAQTPPSPAKPNSAASDTRAFLDTYCLACHNQTTRTAGLALDGVDASRPSDNFDVWERVIEKLRAGSMPPPGMPRPEDATYRAVTRSLENELDRAWLKSPNPGAISPVHRLNRTEYNNAIRPNWRS
jgi:mono/diheme cytochrome c family protein